MKKEIVTFGLTLAIALSMALVGCGADTGTMVDAEKETEIGNETKAESVHDEDYFAEQIQNGYLGTYSTVSIKDVLTAFFPGGEWNTVLMEDDVYYVTYTWYTDYDEQELIVTFQGSDDDSGTFELSDFYYVYFDGIYDSDEDDAQDIADVLNMLYYNYALLHEDSGISEIYYDVRGLVFQGYFGPLSDEQMLLSNIDETSETAIDVSPDGLAALIEESEEYYGLSIDEMRVVLCDSGNSYFTEEEVDVMTDAMVLDEYINLVGNSSETMDDSANINADTVKMTSVDTDTSMYGKYTLETSDAIDTVIAEIYFTSSNGLDYIYLESTHDGEQDLYFFGYLEESEEYEYTATDSDSGVTIIVRSGVDNGIIVTVYEAEYESFHIFDGFYDRTGEID